MHNKMPTVHCIKGSCCELQALVRPTLFQYCLSVGQYGFSCGNFNLLTFVQTLILSKTLSQLGKRTVCLTLVVRRLAQSEKSCGTNHIKMQIIQVVRCYFWEVLVTTTASKVFKYTGVLQ